MGGAIEICPRGDMKLSWDWWKTTQYSESIINSSLFETDFSGLRLTFLKFICYVFAHKFDDKLLQTFCFITNVPEIVSSKYVI